MSYVVIARRYRPQQFADIVGQQHITRTLSNAIANGRIGQAYIFSGPRGVGKTTTARILAMALNCEDGPKAIPDISSPICQAIIQGKSMDVMEIDGASNRRIEEVRNLRENINYMPTEGRYRIYIIDEVHMLTNEAFNALLKTLEEPPAHAVFIFATTEIHRVPATILSRCQRFDFKRIPLKTIIDHLKGICKLEKIEIDDEALLQIARKADGSMRDSQSILDQIISFSGQKITIADVEQAVGLISQDVFFNISEKIKAKDLKHILLLARELFSSGMDLTELMIGLEEHFRNMLVAASIDSTELLDVSESYAEKYKEHVKDFTENDLVAYLNIISQAIAEIKWVQQPFLKFELTLVRLAKMPSIKNIEQILEKLDLVKKKRLNSNETKEQLVAQPIDFNYIKDKWPEIVDKIHASKPTLAKVFELIQLTNFNAPVLDIEVECDDFQKSIIDKNITFIEKVMEQVYQNKIQLAVKYNIVKVEARKAAKKKSVNRKEQIKKFETLKAEDPLFKKFVDEFGLELE